MISCHHGYAVETAPLGMELPNTWWFDAETRAIYRPLVVVYQGEPVGYIRLLRCEFDAIEGWFYQVCHVSIAESTRKLRGKTAGVGKTLSTIVAEIDRASVSIAGVDLEEVRMRWRATAGVLIADFQWALRAGVVFGNLRVEAGCLSETSNPLAESTCITGTDGAL